tara:strand:+ start:125 stop:775 length:651 start_codon:yes stop_codon:yes gene_type:complete
MKSVKIGTLKPNPKNPRLIKNEKYKLLLHSVKVSPAFMLMNPIKVDLDNMILCGNMRYKACMELQKEVVPVEVFTKKHAEINNKARRENGIDEATYEEQCREYIIKDNVSFGEHDWDILGNEYDSIELQEYGMDVWTNNDDLFNVDAEKEDEEGEEENKEPKLSDDKYSSFELVMKHDNKVKLISVLSSIKEKYTLDKMEEAIIILMNKYLENDTE